MTNVLNYIVCQSKLYEHCFNTVSIQSVASFLVQVHNMKQPGGVVPWSDQKKHLHVSNPILFSKKR